MTGYRCAACSGVAHPATGHQHSPAVLICGPCTRRMFAWVAQHTMPRKGQPDFYGAAAKWSAVHWTGIEPAQRGSSGRRSTD